MIILFIGLVLHRDCDFVLSVFDEVQCDDVLETRSFSDLRYPINVWFVGDGSFYRMLAIAFCLCCI